MWYVTALVEYYKAVVEHGFCTGVGQVWGSKGLLYWSSIEPRAGLVYGADVLKWDRVDGVQSWFSTGCCTGVLQSWCSTDLLYRGGALVHPSPDVICMNKCKRICNE